MDEEENEVWSDDAAIKNNYIKSQVSMFFDVC